MKNDYLIGSTKISIPPTVLFSAVSVVKDVRKCVTMDAKKPGDLVYVLGETLPETGRLGVFRPPRIYRQSRSPGSMPSGPRPSMKPWRRRFGRAGSLPATTVPTGDWAWPWPRPPLPAPWAWRWICGRVPASEVERDDFLLFSESASRFVVTIHPEDKKAFEACLQGNVFAEVGRVTAGKGVQGSRARRRDRHPGRYFRSEGSLETPPAVLMGSIRLRFVLLRGVRQGRRFTGERPLALYA